MVNFQLNRLLLLTVLLIPLISAADPEYRMVNGKRCIVKRRAREAKSVHASVAAAPKVPATATTPITTTATTATTASTTTTTAATASTKKKAAVTFWQPPTEAATATTTSLAPTTATEESTTTELEEPEDNSTSSSEDPIEDQPREPKMISKDQGVNAVPGIPSVASDAAGALSEDSAKQAAGGQFMRGDDMDFNAEGGAIPDTRVGEIPHQEAPSSTVSTTASTGKAVATTKAAPSKNAIVTSATLTATEPPTAKPEKVAAESDEEPATEATAAPTVATTTATKAPTVQKSSPLKKAGAAVLKVVPTTATTTTTTTTTTVASTITQAPSEETDAPDDSAEDAADDSTEETTEAAAETTTTAPTTTTTTTTPKPSTTAFKKEKITKQWLQMAVNESVKPKMAAKVTVKTTAAPTTTTTTPTTTTTTTTTPSTTQSTTEAATEAAEAETEASEEVITVAPTTAAPTTIQSTKAAKVATTRKVINTSLAALAPVKRAEQPVRSQSDARKLDATADQQSLLSVSQNQLIKDVNASGNILLDGSYLSDPWMCRIKKGTVQSPIVMETCKGEQRQIVDLRVYKLVGIPTEECVTTPVVLGDRCTSLNGGKARCAQRYVRYGLIGKELDSDKKAHECFRFPSACLCQLILDHDMSPVPVPDTIGKL